MKLNELRADPAFQQARAAEEQRCEAILTEFGEGDFAVDCIVKGWMLERCRTEATKNPAG